ncbi:MAG: DNA recombination protein RmuC, partial [Clostridia bacterium]|nr:DNA recombination protein RmuC [Clostridia bacterium]
NDMEKTIKLFSDTLATGQKQVGNVQSERLSELSAQLSKNQETLHKTLTEMLKSYDERLVTITKHNDEQLEKIRNTMEVKIKSLQDDNNKKLDEMRGIVDTKLQETLNERISKSFSIVSDRLEQVYKGLGEMQSLAAGVGDLKRTLTNVKTRGILGEVQLGNILSDILADDQYDVNVGVNPESSAVVEFAVKLPGGNGEKIYLPIDAKFPLDAYNALLAAQDTGEANSIAAAGREFESRIKKSAKDISTKYICPPYTTDFALMFLPTESIYSEALRRGLAEYTQNTLNVVIVGPTNMAALLNSLRMGFKTLAIQKKSGEVWNVLGAVKTEFGKFADALEKAQSKIEGAGEELNKLVGTRTRMMMKKLESVTELTDTESEKILAGSEDENETV